MREQVGSRKGGHTMRKPYGDGKICRFCYLVGGADTWRRLNGRQECVSESAALGMYAPWVCATHPQRNDTIHATLPLSKRHCQVGGAS